MSQQVAELKKIQQPKHRNMKEVKGHGKQNTKVSHASKQASLVEMLKNTWEKQFECVISENVQELKSDISLQNKNLKILTIPRKRHCKQTKRKDY